MRDKYVQIIENMDRPDIEVTVQITPEILTTLILRPYLGDSLCIG